MCICTQTKLHANQWHVHGIHSFLLTSITQQHKCLDVVDASTARNKRGDHKWVVKIVSLSEHPAEGGHDEEVQKHGYHTARWFILSLVDTKDKHQHSHRQCDAQMDKDLLGRRAYASEVHVCATTRDETRNRNGDSNIGDQTERKRTGCIRTMSQNGEVCQVNTPL